MGSKNTLSLPSIDRWNDDQEKKENTNISLFKTIEIGWSWREDQKWKKNTTFCLLKQIVHKKSQASRFKVMIYGVEVILKPNPWNNGK